MSAEQARVLARIRKMMALANDAGATEGERDNALRAVHATLAKYNLSMAEVEAAGGAKEETREQQQAAFYGRPWAKQMAQSIAHLYFCQYFFIGKGRVTRHVFVGRQSNCTTAREMAKFVVEAVYQEASKYGRSKFEGGEGQAARSFAQGAADRIYTRCKEIREQAEAPTAAPGTALVLANVYQLELTANDAFIKEHIGKLKDARATKATVQQQGYAAGKVYGSSVSLHAQVTGKSQGRLN